jgi:hypothetical protein
LKTVDVPALAWRLGEANDVANKTIQCKPASTGLVIITFWKSIVVRPESTTLLYKPCLMSTSPFMMLWKVVSRTPPASFPIKDGWKGTSGHRKRPEPTVTKSPFGNLNLLLI